jgi:hypothetical protein
VLSQICKWGSKRSLGVAAEAAEQPLSISLRSCTNLVIRVLLADMVIIESDLQKYPFCFFLDFVIALVGLSYRLT